MARRSDDDLRDLTMQSEAIVASAKERIIRTRATIARVQRVTHHVNEYLSRQHVHPLKEIHRRFSEPPADR